MRKVKKTNSFKCFPVRVVSSHLELPGPKVIEHFSCSTQLSMKIFVLINVEMPTIVGISTFMSRKNSILGLSEPEKMLNFLIFLYLPFKVSCLAEYSMKKVL